MKRRIFTEQEAKEIGESIGIDFDQVDLNQFRQGLTVELEHGSADEETDVTHDNLEITGKIAWAHLKELPDYYSRLDEMEKGAKI